MSDPGIVPIAALAKCETCGAMARLDHILPHPTDPTDRYVYRCPSCDSLTIVDRPRRPPEGAPPTEHPAV